MKIIYYRLAGIAMLLALCVQGFSQDVLRYGAAPNQPVVERPLLYWDILRTTSTGWVWQFKTTNQPWVNYEKTVNLKNGDGLFTTMNTLTWVPNTQTWQEDYKNIYSYLKNSSDEVVEAIWETQNSFNNGAVKFENTYTQGKLTEFIVNFRNGGSFIPTTHAYFIYDGNGDRTLDSGLSIQSGMPNYRSVYDYDNNHHCIKNVYWGLNQNNVLDTSYYNTYAYNSNGLLEKASIYYRLANNDPLEESSRYTYTYTSSGAIDEVSIFSKNINTQVMEQNYFYKHYYNNQNKPVAMVEKAYDNTVGWFGTDSIVLNYLPNGGYDTADVYVGQGPDVWETENSQRLVFDKTTTGVRNPSRATTNLKAYPNPVAETLFVELEVTTDVNVEMVLTDITGRVVKTQSVELFAGQPQKAEVQMDGVTPGIYMLRAGGQTLKVVKK